MSKLKLYDFKYHGVDYDYDRISNCAESGCNDSDDYCRCSTIENTRIVDVDVSKMAREIYNLYFDDSKPSIRNSKLESILFDTGEDINLYTIDRILRHLKIWEDHNWDIEVENGYYGEEIGDITLSNYSKVETLISEAFDCESLKDRVEYLLKLEYGYLLPELKSISYKIETIKKSDITFGSLNHKKKVEILDLKHYSDVKYNGIRGLVIVDGDKFKIIDGYHRLTATNDGFVKVIKGKKGI